MVCEKVGIECGVVKKNKDKIWKTFLNGFVWQNKKENKNNENINLSLKDGKME